MTPIASLMASLRIIDLTHDIAGNIPLLPFQQPISFESLVNYSQGAMVQRFTLDEHQGTHADAPAHFVPGGLTIERIPTRTLVTHAYLADVRPKVAANADHRISVDDVLEFEETTGTQVRSGFFIAHTGWSAKWSTPAAYYGLEENGGAHFPGFSGDAVEFLIQQRNIVGIGIDGPSVDGGTATSFPVHHQALGMGMVFIENLNRLEEVGQTEIGIIIAPLKLAGGSGAPARVFALVSEPDGETVS